MYTLLCTETLHKDALINEKPEACSCLDATVLVTAVLVPLPMDVVYSGYCLGVPRNA